MKERNILKWNTIQTYAKSIGLVSDVELTRVKDLFSQAKLVCPQKLQTVFISNYTAEGKEEFKDIWFFSNDYVIEALDFNKTNKLAQEVTILSKNVSDILIETEQFDLSKPASAQSKYRIVVYTLSNFTCDCIAYGVNCDTLVQIFNRFIKPNLVRGQSQID